MGDLYLNRSLTSYHWDRDRKNKYNYNEINPGIGLEYKNGDYRYMLGQYTNSLRNNSNYGLFGYTPFNYKLGNGMLSGGGVIGGLTGYPIADVVPAAGLFGTYENGNYGVNIIAVPTVHTKEQVIDGFMGIQGKYKF